MRRPFLMNRRKILKAAMATSLAVLPTMARGAASSSAAAALSASAAKLPYTIDETAVIYLTPLKNDGAESACQAEVWFTHHQGEIFVVTASDAWRARAIGAGLSRARIWIGDVGVWNSDARYKVLPSVDVVGDQILDASRQAQVLEQFGDKYSLEWIVWGARFRKGLADGSRVMLRYQLG
jgi:hypothetical protein